MKWMDTFHKSLQNWCFGGNPDVFNNLLSTKWNTSSLKKKSYLFINTKSMKLFDIIVEGLDNAIRQEKEIKDI